MTKGVETVQNNLKNLLGFIDFSLWIFRCLENKRDLCLLTQENNCEIHCEPTERDGRAGDVIVTMSWNPYKAFH